MKFCDERIQNHLLNGGKIKRRNQIFSYFLSESLKRFCYKYNNEIREYSISKQDLEADDWTIVEPEYDWNKIIKDKVLCVFSDDDGVQVLGYLKSEADRTNKKYNFWSTNLVPFVYCKPFNSEEFNIAKNLKEYEK